MQAAEDASLIEWLKVRAGAARRTASVCTGAFLLAAAGLLDHRRAVTHWEYCDELSRRHPAVTVEPDPIFVHDGPVWTSAGVTSGIDLSLALVEEDLGRALALERRAPVGGVPQAAGRPGAVQRGAFAAIGGRAFR